ncbi:MAG: hypothetical protein HYY65_03050, partial [Candidatus Tectomicrobia bacterium]|nr:hypothetical protein [Candidatus Tectomicrobia bacterium]
DCRTLELPDVEQEKAAKPEIKTEVYLFEDLCEETPASRAAGAQPVSASAQEALSETEAILRQATEEAARLKEQARSEGLAQGLAEARQQVEERLAPAIAAFLKAGEELGQLRRQLIERQEKEVIELALAIARKVIHQEVTQNPQTIVGILKAILQETVDREELKVHLNPEDFDVGMECRDSLLASVEGIKSLSLERDPNISRGGVVVETHLGEIDGRVERQLDEIEQGLRTQFYRRRRTD